MTATELEKKTSDSKPAEDGWENALFITSFTQESRERLALRPLLLLGNDRRRGPAAPPKSSPSKRANVSCRMRCNSPMVILLCGGRPAAAEVRTGKMGRGTPLFLLFSLPPGPGFDIVFLFEELSGLVAVGNFCVRVFVSALL